MTRLARAFRQKTFISYLVGGDGGIQQSAECCLALIEGGVDVLEIGYPFSDPVGEGPAIVQAQARAMSQGVTLDDVCEVVRLVRLNSDVPIVLMGYYNPLLQRRDAYRKFQQAGVDGLLVVDLPPEEASVHCETCRAVGLDTIFLATPDITNDRLDRVVEHSTGFLYYVCRKGTTGVRSGAPPGLATNLERIRHKTRMPVAVGFGIGSRSTALEVLPHAEGFVVGSAFVNCVNQGGGPNELRELAKMIDPRGVS